MTNGSEKPGHAWKACAGGLSRMFAARDISPVDAATSCLARAEEVDRRLNAFTVIDHDGALAAARASESRWINGEPRSPIDGVPITIKDIVLCQGLDVRYGSRTTPDVSDLPDAPSVARLRAAGAVILGLTTTPEFGWKAVTDSRRNGVSRNPWDRTKTSGGSSGGAAIAAATGAGALHLGTDGGGSIRVPASFCGVVGHKPSFARVASYLASSFGTVAHIGPIARTVEDVVLMLNVMSGRDVRDWTQPNANSFPIAPSPADLKDLRVAYWEEPCVGAVDSEVKAIVQSAVDDLARAGAEIERIRLPDQHALLEIFHRHWYVGAANRLTAVDDAAKAECDPGFLAAASRGQQYSAVDRMQAEIGRAQYGAMMDQLLAEFDFIVSPSVAVAPFEAGSDIPPGSEYKSWIEWASFSFPINLSQQPACTVPCGRTSSGMPVGLQIIGARGADEKLLSAAMAWQEMRPVHFLSRGAIWPVLG